MLDGFGSEPGAEIAIDLDQVVVGEQSFAKFIEVALRDVAIVENAGMGLENFWFAIAEGHNDEHGLGFALGDEIVEDDVGAADGGPAAGVITVPVQEIQGGISLFAARIVAG